jgi:nitrogen fixation NifU-like protein
MMTNALKGKSVSQALELFEQFHRLVRGELKPDRDPHALGNLSIFSGIWEYPSRVKCAILGWHTMKGALNQAKMVSTEE